LAQIRSITSEAIEAQIRRLLPSQNGFTEDMQAQNVIVPTIDLTPVAEGSQLPSYLQNALSFGALTAFVAQNSTATITNNAGFFRVFGYMSGKSTSSAGFSGSISMSDGFSSKNIYNFDTQATTNDENVLVNFDFIAFLSSNDSLTATSNNGVTSIRGSSYQIATVTGDLVNPQGFQQQ